MQKRQTILRYILFQIPEITLIIFVSLIVHSFYEYPFWIFWVIIVGSIIKDIILFNKTWQAYVVHNTEEYSRVIGKTGLAVKDISLHGYINIYGELWKVEVSTPVKKGDQLVVKGVDGLNLKAEKLI